MMLMEGERPSHMAFERLYQDYLINSIDEIFFEISQKIGDLMNINKKNQHIDGTKFEADANKYTFVYKARILNNRKKLFVDITESIVSMNMERGFNFPYGYYYDSKEMGYIAQYLMEVMANEDIIPVYGKGKRRTTIQKWYDKFLHYWLKLNEYEYWLDIIGEDRNSCSKTDHDATMCALKIDYYCNTGLSRPAYNAQIAVSDGLIVNAALYQRPGDTKTLIPFLVRYKEYTGEYPEIVMADAAYGSYDNYWFMLKNQMQLYAKYTMYAKKNDPKFKKKVFNPLNWKTDDKGNKICPNGQVFDQYVGDTYDESGLYLAIKQNYTSKDSCEGCKHLGECCKSKSKRRILSRNEVLNQFYEEVDENLSTEFGKELKKQRSIQAEGAFGVIKQDMGFTRFTRRGLKNAQMEFLIVCLGYNFKKYHNYRLKEEKKVREEGAKLAA